MRPPPPATAAWRPGDDPGHRQFVRIAEDRPLMLEAGGRLSQVDIAYETWGTLSPERDNAVLICHAWTGDSHIVGPGGRGHPSPGWWEEIVGPGRAIDTESWFVVGVNVLGGCQGSTGPASPRPDDGRPYGSRFPTVTIRDMVRVQSALTNHLGIDAWASVIGGSMGGMQALEWAVMYPKRVRSIVPIASCMAASPQQIAWGALGRLAIMQDPCWRGGDYHDAPPGEGPHRGLGLARQIAQVTFRSDEVFEERFGRQTLDGEEAFGQHDRYQVESYLDHHGDKLVRRFDAGSYVTLAKAMDLHDIARGRGGIAPALRRVQVPVLTLGITSDLLYPIRQQREMAAALRSVGVPVEHVELDSPHGHDAFLIEEDRVGEALVKFLSEVRERDDS